MTITNADVAAVFGCIADLMEVQGARPLRVRACRNAGRGVGECRSSVAAMLAAGEDLEQLPGVGPDAAAQIREIVATGTCEQLRRLREELPPAVTELLAIPRLGPRRVRALQQELCVRTVADLLRCARSRRIRLVPGFGPQMERLILEAATARLAQELPPPRPAVAVPVPAQTTEGPLRLKAREAAAVPGVHP